MKLVSPISMLNDARKNRYAVVAFNVHTLEMMQAVVEAADECRSPLILQTTVKTVKHMGLDYVISAAMTAARSARIPIALHLDHCQDFDFIVRCLRSGYTSVMIDASMYSFAENVKRTKQVADIAKNFGANVEAELGSIGGAEDHLVNKEENLCLADPEECEEFVKQTGITTLAPAIGTVHGQYRDEPQIDFRRLKKISQRVQVPLVLHGGSGLPEQHIKRCLSLGIAKINVATELKNIFSKSIREYFSQNNAVLDPRKYLSLAREAVKTVAKQKIEIAGCKGRAQV